MNILEQYIKIADVITKVSGIGFTQLAIGGMLDLQT